MKKRILVIGYSQTGQLSEILSKFSASFTNVDIETVNFYPKKPFVFPWTSKTFFDTMPESVLEKEVALLPISFKSNNYDLIIIGYQPWYLSPSIPATSLLKDNKFLSLLKDTPIITIIGSRNMWLNAQESIKQRIANAGGNLVGNIPFSDRNNNQLSAITILYWMLTGKKDRFLKIFPRPGISSEDINKASIYGKIVNETLHDNSYDNLQKKILEVGLIKIKTNILFIESRAKMLFKIWANIIHKKGTNKRKRKIWINIFKYYLFIALFCIAPPVLLVYTILVSPLIRKSIKKKKKYFYDVKI